MKLSGRFPRSTQAQRGRTSAHQEVQKKGRAKDAGTVNDESNTRTHLIKTLRSSIEAQGQADSKRRKCLEAGMGLENSREGEDQKVLNRDLKVEGAKDDLQQAGLKKCETLSSTNRGTKVGANNQEMHGSNTIKREAQSITNLINAGKAKMMKIASNK